MSDTEENFDLDDKKAEIIPALHKPDRGNLFFTYLRIRNSFHIFS